MIIDRQILRTAHSVQRRSLASLASKPIPHDATPLAGGSLSKKAKKEGDIGSVFASLSGEKEVELPERFLHLKRYIIGDQANQAALKASWERLISRLADLAGEIERKQQACIPEINYDELVNPQTRAHPSVQDKIRRIKQCGTVVIRGVVSEEQATKWLDDLRRYIERNPSVKGFPADDKQVFELYWSKPQLEARSHPHSIRCQIALLSLFSNHLGAESGVSLTTPLTYADRLRIRHPGDARFALGPHIDGGSVERWEDEGYRSVYGEILRGRWEEFDPWEIEKRATANQMIYEGAGTCGTFRAFQGWTSLSHTGPTEGTLRVYPYLRELSAYVLLRPLFRPKSPLPSNESGEEGSAVARNAYLSSENWELDMETSRFPGAPLARGQELNDETHPHLELGRTMVSVPAVKPGDQVFWHCDTIHAVESEHKGTGPSAVMYIPAVPLTPKNLEYIKDQKEAFLAGTPAPDFPGGVGESAFEGRGVVSDILSKEGRSAMGVAPFEITDDLSEGERSIRETGNKALDL